MRHIESEDEYKRIVVEIARTFEDAILDEYGREIAKGLLATFDVIDHEGAVIHGMTYNGESVEIDGSDETLNPYEVIQYSDADIPTAASGRHDVRGQDDQAAAVAVDCLTRDIRNAAEQEYHLSDEECLESEMYLDGGYDDLEFATDTIRTRYTCPVCGRQWTTVFHAEFVWNPREDDIARQLG